MNTVLESLPDEVLLQICFQLHPIDVVKAFRHLNARFDALLSDAHLFRHILIDSDQILPNYTYNIIKYARHGVVRSLIITVRCRWLDLSHFTNLRKLVLHRPSQEQQLLLERLVRTTEHFQQLRELTFITSRNVEQLMECIATRLFPQLRHYHWHRWQYTLELPVSFSPPPGFVNIQSLTLNVLDKLEYTDSILRSLPNLTSLNIMYFPVWSTNIQVLFNSFICSRLKHFSISLSACKGFQSPSHYCKMFSQILPVMPRLKSLYVRFKIERNAKNDYAASCVHQFLTIIAKYLPSSCSFGCNILCETGGQVRLKDDAYWKRKTQAFILSVSETLARLSQWHATFGSLRYRRINQRVVEVYNDTDRNSLSQYSTAN